MIFTSNYYTYVSSCHILFMQVNPLSDHEMDGELWKKFRHGDRLAFQKLYQKYLQDLFNYGFKVTPQRSQVTDAIQDMFIDLWNNKSNLSQTENIKYYLFKALRRRLIRNIKADKRYWVGEEKIAENATLVLPLENIIIEGQENAERLHQLKKAISKLSDRQKELISLIFYEGFSYEECSKLIGINLRSTYTLAWKALASLRKEIVKCIMIPFLFLFS
ncbi:sigma-70 family RNA polymerase sigma factor [Reichenbachiella sp. MALMAid0571]|uniref:RNA polymerase sigma factor n=1 Tax=Reichenbachiella sp. MALMAid0571 TaxID=3143939 RepID=UPI0032E0085D